MKKKLVLWGTGANDEKLLLAIELIESDNAVKVHIFNEDLATEIFYNELMDKWRNGIDVNFPESYESIDRPLSITESILPEHIKVERTDLVNRAKTEWHFVVLSSKLFAMYKSELEDLGEKVKSLTEFESSTWEELKAFWSKVQNQTREKNLFREHANMLREETNKLFDSLKELRKSLETEFRAKSTETKESFLNQLGTIQEKIDKGLGLSPIFNELKEIQNQYRKSKFTKEDRAKVWAKLDGAFKAVKAKRFGNSEGPAGDSSALGRVKRRYDGLISAIGKMESSINRDASDIDHQGKIIQETHGQLEQQIRQAKIKMIEERINSKKMKLEDMLKTKAQLEKRMESLKKKKEKEEEKEKIEQAKIHVKERIAKEIQEKSKETAEDEHVKAAAQAIDEGKKTKTEKKEAKKEITDEKDVKEEQTDEKEEKSESIIGALASTLGESLEDVVDTVKAVADVVSDKVAEKIDDSGIGDSVEEMVSKAKATADDVGNTVNEKMKETGIGDKVEEVLEKAKSAAEDLSAKVSEKLEESGISDKIEEVVDKAKSTVEEIGKTVSNKVEESGMAEKVEELADKAKSVASDISEKASEIVSDIVDDKTEEE